MAGRSAAHLWSAAAAAAWMTICGVMAAPAAAAADPVAQALAIRVTSGVTVDLDGDGSREIVAVRADVAAPTLGVEAWRERDGAWESIGAAPILVADQPGGELRPGRVGADASALLLVTDGGRQRPVLATAPIDGDGLVACCLTLFDVVPEDGAPVLRVAGESLGLAATVRALDLEADGTDELLVTAPVDPAGPVAPFDSIQVLRRTGGQLVADPIVYPAGAGSLAAVGDSDGVPGDDLHFLTRRTITRMSADNGALRTEGQPLGELINVGAGGWVAGATHGVIVAVDGDRSLATAEWPRDGRISPIGRAETGLFPSTFLLGDGARSRIVELAGGFSAENRTLVMRVYDLALRLEREIVAPRAVQAMWDAAVFGPARLQADLSRARPAVGPVSGGSGDGAAFLGAGTLLELDAGGRLVVHPALPYAGEGAMALAGTEARWLVSGMGWNSLADSVIYLIGGEPGTQLSALPLEILTAPAGESGSDLSIAGATEVEGPDGEVLYVSDDGFSATVRAGPGAWVFGVAGAAAEVVQSGDAPVTIELHPEAPPGGEDTFTATVIVLEPSGIADVATWDAAVLAGLPNVRVESSAVPFAARATVSGGVDGPATIEVDGATIRTAADGTFRVDIDAPIWGRDVTVVARDPLGREAAERVTAVGFVDYRTLPWMPIVGGFTVAAGAVLYLRTPRPRAGMQPLAEGDGDLEEIDEDQA